MFTRAYDLLPTFLDSLALFEVRAKSSKDD